MGSMRRIYKPKNENEHKLNAFIKKLENNGLFQEELKNGKDSKNNSIS